MGYILCGAAGGPSLLLPARALEQGLERGLRCLGSLDHHRRALPADVRLRVKPRHRRAVWGQAPDEHLEAPPRHPRQSEHQVYGVLPEEVSLDPGPALDQVELRARLAEVRLPVFRAFGSAVYAPSTFSRRSGSSSRVILCSSSTSTQSCA